MICIKTTKVQELSHRIDNVQDIEIFLWCNLLLIWSQHKYGTFLPLCGKLYQDKRFVTVKIGKITCTLINFKKWQILAMVILQEKTVFQIIFMIYALLIFMRYKNVHVELITTSIVFQNNDRRWMTFITQCPSCIFSLCND